MNKNLLRLIITCGFLILLPACTMRASRAPVLKITPVPEIPFAVSAGQSDPQSDVEVMLVASGTGGESESSGSDDEEVEPTPDTHLPPTYSLQSGEWPMCIARRYNLDPAALLSASGLNFESKPDVGYVLTLPQNTYWPDKFGHRYIRIHPADHTVVAGETLFTISCAYGDVDPSGIVSENELEEPYNLTAGQVLHIP
ncbi:MAG: LysM peptidoglycan-binding domain-containing protein [Anaerolineaceae bacterium]